jgi:CubicO group peptidase (beta-lactamase class C family)
LLQPFFDRLEVADAVVLLLDRAKVLALETVGFAVVGAHKPMEPGTLFWIASQSKSMTAVAVVMLVNEVKILLDDPLKKYVPGFREQMLVSENFCPASVPPFTRIGPRAAGMLLRSR